MNVNTNCQRYIIFMPAVTEGSDSVKCWHYVCPIKLTPKNQRTDTRSLKQYNNLNNSNNFL